MNHHAVDFLFCIGDFYGKILAVDAADVADLAAGFSVKRRLVGNQVKFTVVDAFNRLSVLYQRGDLAVGFGAGVAEKFAFAQFVKHFKPDLFDSFVTGTGPVFAGFGALLFHGAVKTFGIDADVFGFQRILGEVKREAVSVVKFERGFAGQGVAGSQICGFVVQEPQAFFQRADKFAFFGFQRFRDQCFRPVKFGIGFAHFPLQGRQQLVHHRFSDAQKVNVTHRPAHNAAQNVAAPFV